MTGEEGKRGLFTCEGGRLELLPVKGEEGKGRMLQRQERRRTDNDNAEEGTEEEEESPSYEKDCLTDEWDG